jgi:hypothetical protein
LAVKTREAASPTHPSERGRLRAFLHPPEAILSHGFGSDETCITINHFLSLEIDRFLAHFAQLFSHRGRPEACGEQEEKSCLRKRVKINVSIFFRGDE